MPCLAFRLATDMLTLRSVLHSIHPSSCSTRHASLYIKPGAIALYEDSFFLKRGLFCFLQKAKKKAIDVKTPAQLGVDIKPRIQVLSVQDPPVREAGIKVADVDTLISKLKELGFVKT